MTSPSGIPALGDLAPGTHVGQLYRDRFDLLETLVPFFASGLARNERCVWITSQPLDVGEARDALANVVLDLSERERRGQIEIKSHEDWYTQGGTVGADSVIQRWLDAEEAALRDGYTALRISGNTFWLEPEDWAAFIDYEARAHDAFAGRKVIALCSYALTKCGPHDVVDVLSHHSVSLVRSACGWEVVHGATAALASLESVKASVPSAVNDTPTSEYRAPQDPPDSNEAARLRKELAQVTRSLAHEMARRQEAESAYASSRLAREQLVRLERLAAALGEVTTRFQLGHVVTEIVSPTLGADGVVVVEYRDRGKDATLVAHGVGIETLCHAALAAGSRPLWSDDVAASERALEAHAVIPLIAGGNRLGACALGFTTEREQTAAYRALVHDVGRQLARALERAATYERLEHEWERAELASRAKDEFLAMLGHELRNPLSPILTATQLMRLRGTDGLEREREVIERQVKHMIRLVDDLLDVSRFTRGKVELRRRAIDLADVIAQAVELSSPALEERAHRLTLDVPSAGIVVHVDPQRLAQVLSNLLTNAAKYTPPGGEIHLAVKSATSTVTVTVRDNGIGIDPKLLPHVFELFVQGRQGIDRASGGLGLGLAIARSLLEMHGGTLRVHSDGPGKGSEFTVELPRFANTRATRNSMSGPFAMPAMKGRRILVVDDNEDAAFLFSEALKRLGHNVSVAHDGPSALASARDNPPEVAFLDIGLPVMDGYELGRRLRDLPGDPPRLIAVTGYGHTSDRERSRDAGFDQHLVKPIELTIVQEALAKLE